jgi:hypothetical protein
MVKSFSNIGTNLFLNVSLMPFSPDGSKPSISITPPNFPNEKLIDFIKSEDQQLIKLEDIIDEFIEEYVSNEDRLKMAEYLELLADKIRRGTD